MTDLRSDLPNSVPCRPPYYTSALMQQRTGFGEPLLQFSPTFQMEPGNSYGATQKIPA